MRAYLLCCANCQITLRNHKGENLTKPAAHDFCEDDPDWGFSQFVSWADLTEPRAGYIKDDSITVLATIKVQHSLLM